LFKNFRKYALRILDIFGVILFLFFVFAGWKLYNGPISLDFLNPYIVDALTPDDGKINIKLETTKLMRGRGIRPFDVRAYKINITKENGEIFAQIPEISVDFSFKALFNGVIAPENIELLHPSFYIVRDENGDISFSSQKTKSSMVIAQDQHFSEKKLDIEDALSHIAKIYADSSIKYLDGIDIINSEVSFVDKKNSKSLYFPDIDFSLKKQFNKIKLDTSATLNIANRNLYAKLSSLYQLETRELKYKLSFNNIKSLDIMDFVPNSEFLSSTNLTFKGNLKGLVSLGKTTKNTNSDCSLYGLSCGAFRRTGFVLSTGVGTLTLPEGLDSKYTIYNSKFVGKLSPGLKGFYIDSANIDFGGPSVSLTSEIVGLRDVIKGNGLKSIKSSLSAHIKRLPFDDLPRYWPASFASQAHDWIEKSLSEGVFETSDFTLNFSFDENEKIKIESLEGVSEMTGVTVDYIDGMPLVKDVKGRAKFNNDKIEIDVFNGNSIGLLVSHGTLKFLDLWGHKPKADFYIKTNGKITNALKIVDSKPLEYAKKLGISPEKIKGNAETNLYLKFPFEENLSMKKVKIEVVSILENVSIPDVYMKHDLNKASLNLLLDNNGMDITGSGMSEDEKVSISWHESFDESSTFKNRYKVTAILDDKSRPKFGLDFPPFVSPYMTGNVKMDLVYKEKIKKDAFLGVSVDLVETNMFIPGFGWKKNKGEAASGMISAVVAKGKLNEVSSFRLFAKGLELQGKVDLEKQSADVKRIRFNTFKIGRTDAKAHVTKEENDALTIDLSGNVFDLRELIDKFFEDDEINKSSLSKETKKGSLAEKAKEMPIVFNVAVDKVWGSKKGFINKVGAIIKRNEKGRKQLDLVGILPSGERLNFFVIPQNSGGYTITSRTKDAGGMLKSFGLLENIKSGDMKLDINIDKNNNWKGKLEIKGFRLLSAPVFARLLTVASLTGVVDLLSGEGIGFDKLDLPFEYSKSKLRIKDAKATGTSLGITGKGFIDFDENKNNVVMEGVIAPAYLINSLLGKIPLIGDLFGGRDGGGLFAATYEIKGNRKEPEIRVNPLTALAPGFLRSIFGGAVEEAEKRELLNTVPKAINSPPPSVLEEQAKEKEKPEEKLEKQ
jgi:hypothetical protein